MLRGRLPEVANSENAFGVISTIESNPLVTAAFLHAASCAAISSSVILRP